MGSALFALYAAAAGGDVGWEDSAFFQLCHAVLGVPHGPGFPLYVLLGRVFVWPFAGLAALGSNLFSALTMALAGAVLLEVMLLLEAKATDGRGDSLPRWKAASAAAVVLLWATLSVNRQQATRTEVYGLVLLLVLFVCYFALRARGETPGTRRRGQWVCAAAWCWGLGMAVHPLIVVAGATPWLAYAASRERGRVRLATLVSCAFLPLTLYLFPVLRGLIPGVWAWGDFTSLPAILDYFTRRSAWDAVVAVDGGWIENLAGWSFGLHQLWPAGLWIPTVLGLWLIRKTWAHGISLACLFALVLWAAPYDPANLDLLGYFLPAIALLAAGGGVLAQRCVRFIWMQLPGLSARSRMAMGFFLLCLAAGWPVAAYVSAHESHECSSGAGQIVEQLGASLPAGATLLVSEDNFLGMLEFVVRTRGFRPDLNVIAIGALRYPFYRRTLAATLPDEWVESWDFTQTWNHDRWEQELRRLLSFHRTGERWFAQFDRIPGLAFESVSPCGFVQALSDDTAKAAWDAGLVFWKDQVISGRHCGQARGVLGRWIFNFGVLALEKGHTSQGWEAMLLAVEQSPQDPEIYYLLGQALGHAGRESESVAMLSAALELAPYRERYRVALGQHAIPAVAVLP